MIPTRASAPEAELVEALAAAHYLETAQLATRIARLTALCREHGLALPSDDPLLGTSDGEHLVASRRVVIAAYELLAQIEEFTEALTELREMVGSGMELVSGEPWRKS